METSKHPSIKLGIKNPQIPTLRLLYKVQGLRYEFFPPEFSL